MTDLPRLKVMTEWVNAHFCVSSIVPERASADASFRSYWRITHEGQRYIIMDAPPGKEDVRPWLKVAQRLRKAGLHAPDVLETNIAQGFLLMSDLGVRPYLFELNENTVDNLYNDALNATFVMQTRIPLDDLDVYDERLLINEMKLCPEWFLQRHLKYELTSQDQKTIESAFQFLANSARQQPQSFVHRDFHSRNLLITEVNNPGVIDFQDAVVGPITYDLVSLLRDCYIEWPDKKVEKWVENYRQRLVEAKVTKVDRDTFERWFDLMGLQRHIKVLGIFCRLWYRDGKAQYLHNLPLVIKYTLSIGKRYPQLRAFTDLMERALAPEIEIQIA